MCFSDARFVKLCEKDKFCSSKLSVEIKKYGNLTNAWCAIYKTLDTVKSSENKCVAMFQELYGDDTKPSENVKSYLDTLTGDLAGRLLIPAIMHRLFNCEADDVKFLKMVLTSEIGSGKISTAYDQMREMSPFLEGLIKASEMWTFPSSTWKEEVKNFENGLFSTNILRGFIDNCIFYGQEEQSVVHSFRRRVIQTRD